MSGRPPKATSERCACLAATGSLAIPLGWQCSAGASAAPATDNDGAEAGGRAEPEGVPRAGHVGERADDR